MRTRLMITLMTLGVGCAGMGGGVSFENSCLEQASIQVSELPGGWVRIRSPEGYSFIMPSAPRLEEETFRFGGAPVPQRHFQSNSEQNSRGFFVRVFDVRDLDAATRRGLRAEAMQLFQTAESEVLSQGRLRHAGLDLEVTIMDGFGAMGRHVAVLHSFEENGFVWFLMLIYEEGYGGPGDVSSFFARRL